MHKYYYIYKITLLKGRLAGHYYYGQHRTNNLNDGYAGSGKILKDYYKKYGKNNGETYLKVIIKFYENLEELNKGEYEIIGEKYNTDLLCLNMRAGGMQHGCNENLKKRLSEHHHNVSGANNPMYGKTKENNPNYGSKRSEETKKKISESLKGKQIWWIGKKHNEKTKQLQSEHYVGNKGMSWFINTDTGKRIYYRKTN